MLLSIHTILLQHTIDITKQCSEISKICAEKKEKNTHYIKRIIQISRISVKYQTILNKSPYTQSSKHVVHAMVRYFNTSHKENPCQ